MLVLWDARVPIRAAPKEQQERHSKKAYQDTRKGRRHIRPLCVDRAWEGTWRYCPDQAIANWRGAFRRRTTDNAIAPRIAHRPSPIAHRPSPA
jgi:hypothetical protein